ASWRDILSGIRDCTVSSPDRQLNTRRLQKIWTTAQNPNHVLPCLSVRTGLDLFLTVKKFPPGSEIIMSAINIPDMARVVRHHGVRVIPIDVHVETLSPKVELLEGLITERTVAVLVAHLYHYKRGKATNGQNRLHFGQ
ncbi:Hypp9665, partial [Branchiostoma lanceolatum]